ncbi:MAG: hypothetical protein ACXWCZ_13490, partial [Flavisolibacter sp.]
SPEVTLMVDNSSVTLNFFVNYFLFDNFNEGDRAKVTFNKCHKYSFNNMNDEGYYMGQYRYKYTDLPWGEFYLLDSDWHRDFPIRQNILLTDPEIKKQHHYIFFFKDNTFECVAEEYQLEFIKAQ